MLLKNYGDDHLVAKAGNGPNSIGTWSRMFKKAAQQGRSE